MPQRSFVYAIYIRTTPEKLWEALIEPEFTKQYWFGGHQESTWKAGAPWTLHFSDGRVADTGEVVEIDPPRHLVLKWRNEFSPELKAEGYSRCTFDIEQDGEIVKLTIRHETEQPTQLIDKVSNGWPKILSSLKTLLETGHGLPRTHG